jgi:hydrogenase nickel incorporation protein HypA/HybF
MHEMSLAEGVLQLIEDAARQQEFSKVNTVWLEIGQLSGVEIEAMKFCFDAVTRDSIAQGARLEIIALPGTGWCMACAQGT